MQKIFCGYLLSYWKNNRFTGVWATFLALALLYVFPLINSVQFKSLVAQSGFFSTVLHPTNFAFALDLIGGFVVLFMMALFACYLVFNTNYVSKFTYLPALCIVLSICVFPELLFLQTLHLVFVCMLWLSFSVNYILYSVSKSVFPFLHAGLASGLVFLIGQLAISLSFAFILGGFVLQEFNFKKLVVYLLGIVLPVFFYCSYWFWLYGMDFYLTIPIKLQFLIPEIFSFKPAIASGYFFFYLLLAVLSGLYLSTFTMQLSVIQKRQTTWHLCLILISSIALVLQYKFSYYNFLMLLPLCAVVLSKFLWHSKNKWVINFLLFTIAIIAFLSHAAFFL